MVTFFFSFFSRSFAHFSWSLACSSSVSLNLEKFLTFLAPKFQKTHDKQQFVKASMVGGRLYQAQAGFCFDSRSVSPAEWITSTRCQVFVLNWYYDDFLACITKTWRQWQWKYLRSFPRVSVGGRSLLSLVRLETLLFRRKWYLISPGDPVPKGIAANWSEKSLLPRKMLPINLRGPRGGQRNVTHWSTNTLISDM